MRLQLVDATVEFCGRRPVLARLLRVLLIEALLSASEHAASPGFVLGLADERLAVAIRRMHEQRSAPWTVAELALLARLSDSSA